MFNMQLEVQSELVLLLRARGTLGQCGDCSRGAVIDVSEEFAGTSCGEAFRDPEAPVDLWIS